MATRIRENLQHIEKSLKEGEEGTGGENIKVLRGFVEEAMKVTKKGQGHRCVMWNRAFLNSSHACLHLPHESRSA